jgi:hypothetical protein
MLALSCRADPRFPQRPCKLRAVVIHGGRHGWGVQFREGHPQSLANLSSYWSALDEGRVN